MIKSKTDIDITPEKEYQLNSSSQHRKKYAQFFTPVPIAEIMVSWLFGNSNLKDILEPAFGLGIFSRLLINQNDQINITGYEIDSLILSYAKEYFKDVNQVNIVYEDYMYNDWNNKYDGIICNPPYFKFHDYDNKNILLEIEEKLSFKLNGFTNLYTLFLLKSITQLKPNGRVAYLIPSEFLNSDYGKYVKQYIVKSNLLRYVIVFDFEENVFENALTTSAILLFSNDNKSSSISFLNISKLEDLKSILSIIKNYPESNNGNSIASNEVNSNIKWRNYYQTQNSLKFKNLIPFSHVGKVVRGIATGDNSYFVFNKSKAKRNKISDTNLLPCISRSSDITLPFFNEVDYQNLVLQDKNVYLFDGTRDHNPGSVEYIKQGVKNKVNEKYLTSKRNPWFAIENRNSSPIWVSVFHRGNMKFIRNYTEVKNLTTFHCVYLNMFSEPKVDVLFAYLLTNVAQQIFEDNRREYGNGLKKFEPNDINHSLILNIFDINESDTNFIISCLEEYENSIYKNFVDSEKFLNKINNTFLELFSK